MLPMESMQHSCLTTCLHLLQLECTCNGLFDNYYIFPFLYCLCWRLPVILPTSPTIHYGICTMPLYFTLTNFIQHTQCVLSIVSSCMNSRVMTSASSLQKRWLSTFLA